MSTISKYRLQERVFSFTKVRCLREITTGLSVGFRQAQVISNFDIRSIVKIESGIFAVCKSIKENFSQD